MRQFTVRDVPEEIMRALKARAAEHGRTPQAEVRLILEQVLNSGSSDFWDQARNLRAKTAGRRHTPSEVLIRETRDER